ncbi:hypothetical protein [Vibrio proteolyticus]|uniref:Uncharacterized protein n=1 Tax=Vibrio proteolyticus NBRC 13287 TaxID=1219065 RepID=U3BAK7_VIBPR|nr:hypothetical protein [Vibrio proteolyticus]GAD66814.1 hypothetical protein VPR01S_05_01090 [Vibrio proteolyticus NBRC 13287]
MTYRLSIIMLSTFTFYTYASDFDLEKSNITNEDIFSPYIINSNSNMVPSGNSGSYIKPHSMSITDSGKYVLFHNTLPRIPLADDSLDGGYFLKNTETNQTTRLGQPASLAYNVKMINPSMSSNGRYIGFTYTENSRDYNGVIWDRLEDKLLNAKYPDEMEGKCINKQTHFNIYPINENFSYYEYTCDTGNKLKNDKEKVVGITDIQNKSSRVINIDIDGDLANIWLSPSRVISNDGRYLTYTSTEQMDINNIYDDKNKEIAIYLYDRIKHKSIKIKSNKTDFIHQPSNFYSSISPDGKFLIYPAKKPENPEKNIEFTESTYLSLYNIDTGISEYVKGPDDKLIHSVMSPTISNNGESIAFLSKSEEYNTAVSYGPKGPQAYYYDRINEKILHVSISQITGESVTSSDALVYGNGKGILWASSSGLVDQRESGTKHLYTLGKPIIPEICKPYLDNLDVRSNLPF